MSVQTNWEEKRDDYNSLVSYRYDLRQLEKKRDDFTGDIESEEYEKILNEIEYCEYQISDYEEILGIN
jgi:hypothetical protein